jgi:hypothetical protein
MVGVLTKHNDITTQPVIPAKAGIVKHEKGKRSKIPRQAENDDRS